MDLDALEKILGTVFTDKNLLREALTHRSFLNEDPNTRQSNERLEFLGDSVLSLLCSTELFKKFPDFPEGKLTNLRSAIVRTQTLGKVAKQLNFGQFLLMSRGEEQGGGRENLSLLADTFEAILGAIYLDSGLVSAKVFLDKHLFSQIESLKNDQSIYDYKSRLQELAQNREKLPPVYKVIRETGPDHAKIFTVTVSAGEDELGRGVGKSKQEAEQEAARIALDSITK